jgi:hypothetical protein
MPSFLCGFFELLSLSHYSFCPLYTTGRRLDDLVLRFLGQFPPWFELARLQPLVSGLKTVSLPPALILIMLCSSPWGRTNDGLTLGGAERATHPPHPATLSS